MDDFTDWKPSTTHPLVMKDRYMAIFVGIPGSTKSTYAAKLAAQDPNLVIISPDLLRLELTGDISNQSKNGFIFNTLLPCRINTAMTRRHNILIDATSTTKKARKPLIEQAKANGYGVKVIVMKATLEGCKERNAARERVVPDFVLDKMYNQWQEPELSEGIDEITHVIIDDPAQELVDQAQALSMGY